MLMIFETLHNLNKFACSVTYLKLAAILVLEFCFFISIFVVFLVLKI